jgi:hypothetical protein
VSGSEARAIIETIRSEVEQAADMMLSAAEKGLRDLDAARTGQATALDAIERTLCAILEACAFQDLTGQRLSKLELMMEEVRLRDATGDPLLHGPALAGEGLDQSGADALMQSGTS